MTNKQFKYRDTREDGYIFWGYKFRAGKVREDWYSPESFARLLEGKARRKRLKAKTPDELAKQARYEREYKIRSPHMAVKHHATRRCRKVLTGRQEIIEMFYEIRERVSRCTGFVWHVDHIKALAKGGEHNENNLQVITAKANLRKSFL